MESQEKLFDYLKKASAELQETRNRLRRKEAAAPAPPPGPTPDQKLLIEIRDAIRANR